MRKTILFLGVIVIFTTVSFAQTKNDTIKTLQHQIVNLQNLNSKMSIQVGAANSNIVKLEGRLSSTADSIALLKKELILTNRNLLTMSNKLEMEMQKLTEKSNSDISTVNERVNNNNLYFIIAIISIVIIFAVMFALLRNRLTVIKTDLSEQIKNSTRTIREEIIKLDNQVYWSLDLQKSLNKVEQNESGNIDHSLILKVADEIVRIQKKLSSMDPETKGLKHLEFAVDRIQDNFKENGYEMIDLLNRSYDQGMQVSAKFKPDNTIKRGEQIITSIIKPQVNYKNVIIQEAQVEVSVGEKDF